MERNPECGFQSDDVLAHSSWNGTIGRADGTVTYEIHEPCLIELRAETPIQKIPWRNHLCRWDSLGFWSKNSGLAHKPPDTSVVPNSASATTRVNDTV